MQHDHMISSSFFSVCICSGFRLSQKLCGKLGSILPCCKCPDGIHNDAVVLVDLMRARGHHVR